MRRSLLVVFFLVTVLVSLRVAQAAPVVWLIAEHNSNVGLVTVDLADTTVNIIGDLNQFMTDIAFDSNGTLYGTDGGFLFEINTTNGTPTSLYSFEGGNSLAYGANGLLYGNGGDILRTIDPLTGMVNDLGPIGFSGAGDLAFNNGKLYMTTLSDLIEIDPLTGIGTLVGSLDGFIPVITPGAEAFGLASVDGLLMGVSDTLIFSIDTLTGEGTPLVDYAGQGAGFAGGMAFQNTALPVPGALMLMLSGTLGLLGVSRRGQGVGVTAT